MCFFRYTGGFLIQSVFSTLWGIKWKTRSLLINVSLDIAVILNRLRLLHFIGA